MRRREALQTYLYKVVHGKEHGFWPGIILRVLTAFSLLYTLGVKCKLALYQHGWLRRKCLPCLVISLGNITLGGTGKTPTAQVMARTMRDMGYKVAVLNRGYRGTWRGRVGVVSDGRKIYMTAAEAGDEAYLLAKNLPGVPVLIGRRRYLTGRFAYEQFGADVVILDDGYQHWQLYRDLDIVLIDAMSSFGNNHVLPRGTLREPLPHLNRAHAFLLTKTDQAANGTEQLRQTITRYNPQAAIVESIHKPCYFIEITDWYKGAVRKKVSLEAVRGRAVMVMSAIGNPASFEHSIARLGAARVEPVRYPDHHDYTMAEMQHVLQRAVDDGAAAIITTEKDAVKIPSEFIHSSRPLPIYILGMEVTITDGQQDLADLMRRLLVPWQERKNRA